ncbi:MAG TPA: phage major capsid protein [Planctomycetaceae bacterium]|nr:phage major capsid protein [Planctomycetaceae bacterium]
MTLQEMREALQTKESELKQLGTQVEERRSAGKTGAELWSEGEQERFETLTGEIGELQSNIECEERAESLQSHLARANEQRNQQRRNGRVDPRLSDQVPGTDLDYGDIHSDRDSARNAARREEQRCLALHGWVAEYSEGNHLTDAHLQAMSDLNVGSAPRLEARGADNATAQQLRGILGTRPTAEQRSEARSMLERRSLAYDANYEDWVPTAFRDSFEIAFHGQGGVLSLCDLLITDSADQLPWPFADDFANTGRQVNQAVPENQAGADAEILIPTLGAYDFTSGYARISEALLANSPFDLATMLAETLATRLVKAIEEKLTDGDRNVTFGGFLHRGVQGTTAPNAAPITLPILQQLIWSLISEHREMGTLVLHDQTLQVFASLVDANDQPLLGVGNGRLQFAKDVSIPVKTSRYITAAADASVGDKIAAFGNFKQQKVRIVRRIRLKRLVEKFADTHEAAFIANRSADADLLRGTETANCPIKYIQTV